MSRRAAPASIVLVAALACGRAEVDIEDPPTRSEHEALASARTCSRCHAEVAREWRESGHAQAWTDPLVQREYQAAPDPSCVGCHAPLTPEGEQPRGSAAHDGVDCRSCHAQGDALTPSATLAQSQLCGRCHQFRFLPPEDSEALAYDPSAWLQDTLGEWSRSSAAARGVGCRDCHMPWVGEGGGRHRSHAFPGMLDARLVASAVDVTIVARREGELVLVDAQLSPGAIGHAFPTGDLFREAVLRVWTEEPESRTSERLLKRWFAAQPPSTDGSPTYVVEVDDTRVPPPGAGPPRRFELRLHSPTASAIGWSLDLRAANTRRPDPGQRRVRVAEGRVKIAAGG
jgi:hypothetical protein